MDNPAQTKCEKHHIDIRQPFGSVIMTKIVKSKVDNLLLYNHGALSPTDFWFFDFDTSTLCDDASIKST